MPNSQWLDAALEEYKSLRTESLTAMANQQATLRFGITALGVALSLAMNTQQAPARFWAFSVLVPIFALVFFAQYSIEFGRMVRVGRYISEVENTINSKLSGEDGPPLGWEKWLAGKKEKVDPRLPFYQSIPIMFMAVTVFSFMMVLVFPKGGPFSEVGNVIFSGVICTVIVSFIVVMAFKLKGLRERYDELFPNSVSSKVTSAL